MRVGPNGHGSIMTYAAREESRPLCPSCGKPMHLARTIPGIGGLPELHVYSCKQCGVSVTEVEERGDLAGRRRRSVTA